MALFDKTRRFFRTVLAAPGNIQDLADFLHDRYIPRAEHDARVSEVLAYANGQVDRRRKVRDRLKVAEEMVDNAVQVALQNTALARGFDYVVKHPLSEKWTLDMLRAFARGFSNLPFDLKEVSSLREAYDYGRHEGANHQMLVEKAL